ncbi:RNA polymerase sigma-70 factor, ECF subfamily [Labilithrix luteola]|uniref:RNA polymerase sigma-70 factor, ECF subfamily n=1 Tax=Labilithrix luteola TaxID=1391654 RepID=A0A0K1PPA4_9BACT|nr:sigma-70 family RNA polymerase sigma factor [Labilithrix luteola]AKU94954.1 RNA polymerase sigma-70 factor, ECF subfamily [Labilithrix luteola]
MTEPQDYLEAVRPTDADVKQVLVENHREFLRFLERRLGRRDLAEDILQDAFARGMEKLETLRDGEAVVPWFYRTLRNATVDYWRRSKSADKALAQFAQEIETSEEPPETIRGEVCRCVARLADTLKPEYADALRRIEVDGVSVISFAEEMGISKSNAAVRVFRAREALRRQVAVSCGTCADHGCLNCTCGTKESAGEKKRGCGGH